MDNHPSTGISRRALLQTGIAVGATAAVAAPASRADAARRAAQGTSLHFSPGGIYGGGTTSVVAADPFQSGVLLAGQDTSGLWRSTDHGHTWTPVCTATDWHDTLFATPTTRGVAALAFSRTHRGLVYAGLGNANPDAQPGSGIARSVDGGLTWTLASDVPTFVAGNPPPGLGLPSPAPRSVGNLISIDERRGRLYAATFSDGVMRSELDGRSWTTLGLDGKYLRGLAIDPANPDVLYACTFGHQVWKTTTASGGGTFNVLASSPSTVEELVIVGGVLYAAAGADGVYASPDAGKTWNQLYHDGDPDTRWLSIAGRTSGGTACIFAGAWQAKADPTDPSLHQTVVRSTDGGSGWTPITVHSAAIHPDLGGPGGAPWWPSEVPTVWKRVRLGGSGSEPAHLLLDPSDRNRLYSAGRGGMWRTDNARADVPDWYPAVRDLNPTFSWNVVIDPNAPNRVYVGDTDWTFFYSTDRMASAHQFPVDPTKSPDVVDIALDTSHRPSHVYVTTDTVTNGELFWTPEPGVAAWRPTGLAAAVHAGCGSYHDGFGVTVGTVNGERVLLAAVSGAGVWRKAGDDAAPWSQVLAPGRALGPQSTKSAPFCWAAHSQSVYLYDRETGLWRSTDAGLSWQRISDITSPLARNPYGTATGYLTVVSIAGHDRLYLSTSSGLFRIDDPASGPAHPSAIGQVTRPGPVASGGGELYVARYAVIGDARPALLRASLDNDTSWVDVADGVYRTVGYLPRGIAVGTDGYVYVSQRGQSVTVGVPGSARRRRPCAEGARR